MDLPPGFVETITPLLGKETTAFLESLDEPSPVSIRYNLRKIGAPALPEPVPWADSATYLNSRPSFTLDPLFHAGAYYVQEASSMFIGHALRQLMPENRPLKVLDLCAAPGGKSTLLLDILPANSLLVSNDVIRSRATILSENLTKWGCPNGVVTNNDPRDFGSLEGFFDIIVVDAPCSGEGLFRKDAGATAEWSASGVELCARRQQRILEDVWPSLKENGLLIYCTCTFNESENEGNLQWLSDRHDIKVKSLSIEPSWNVSESKKGGVVGYRFFPHLARGEGFFLSAIQKSEPARLCATNVPNYYEKAPNKLVDEIRPWINSGEVEYLRYGEQLIMIPAGKLADISVLARALRVISAGTAVGSVKRSGIVPEHALAMSILVNRDACNTVNVDKDTALEYLRRASPQIAFTEKGHHLVAFQNVPLGWVNNIGQRYNNLYPVGWRIRMSDNVGR